MPANTPPEEKPEVRKHYFLDQYVVVSPNRGHSLHHSEYPKAGQLKTPPLEDETSVLEIPGSDGSWAVKVIRNIYPAFSTGNKKAFGVQEILLENNPADVPFGQLPVEQINRVFAAYCSRIQALEQLKQLKYISIFHNNGLEAGASVKQIHSQIIALGVAPPELIEYARAYNNYKKQYGSSPLTRASAWEKEQLARLIHSDDKITIIAPYASQYPYEVWLIPKREIKSICNLENSEKTTLAKGLKAITLALESEQMSYNFMLQEPLQNKDNHFMIRVAPRPNVWAGLELNTGIVINPVMPEEAARWYRKFIKEHNVI